MALKLDILFGGDATKLFRTMGNVQRSALNVGKNLAAVGLTAGLFSVKRAVDFSDGLAKVNTIAKLGKSELAAFGEAIKGVSVETGVSKVDLLSASYQALSGGVEKNVASFVKLAAILGRVGGGTTKEAAESLIRLRDAFPDSSDEEIADKVFTTVKTGIITIGELSSNIGKVSGTAKLAGVGLDDMLAAIATLTKTAGSPEEAMTALNATMSAFINPSKEMKKALRELRVESGTALIKQLGLGGAMAKVSKEGKLTAEELAKLFTNVRALKGGAGLLAGDMALLNKVMDEHKNSANAVGGAWRQMLTDSEKIQFDQMIQQLDNLAISVGQKILPQMSELIERLGEFADDEGNIESIATAFGAVAEVITFLLILFGKLISAMKEFTENDISKTFDFILAVSERLNLKGGKGSPVEQARTQKQLAEFTQAERGEVLTRLQPFVTQFTERHEVDRAMLAELIRMRQITDERMPPGKNK